jgi:hypothetical protein
MHPRLDKKTTLGDSSRRPDPAAGRARIERATERAFRKPARKNVDGIFLILIVLS